MLILISPAKTLDFETKSPACQCSTPEFVDQAATLIQQLQKFSPGQVSKLMSVSDQLARLNHERFRQWSATPSGSDGRAAIDAFQGDVYQGLQAAGWKAAQRKYAQQHLRILSGLYGVLKPLDAIMPYRLEMGTRLKTKSARNLYEFWRDQLTEAISVAVESSRSTAIVNLASQEYFKAVHRKQLSVPVITPVFKDLSNGKYRVISFFAKKARGRMADWIIRNKVKSPAELTHFKEDGYGYQDAESKESAPVFFRTDDDQETT